MFGLAAMILVGLLGWLFWAFLDWAINRIDERMDALEARMLKLEGKQIDG